MASNILDENDEPFNIWYDDDDGIADACMGIVDAIKIAVIKCTDPMALRLLVHLGGYTKDQIKPAFDHVVAKNKTAFINDFKRAGM